MAIDDPDERGDIAFVTGVVLGSSPGEITTVENVGAPPFTVEEKLSGKKTNLISSTSLAASKSLFAVDSTPSTIGPSLLIFKKSQSGNVAPKRAISGSNTMINIIAGCAFDSAENLWCTNQGPPDAILEFGPTADGNVSPINVITGPSTTLNAPERIAIDAQGNLWVTNFNTASILEFQAGSTGNVAPSKTIAGPNTMINSPFGIAVDSAHGHLWVTNVGTSSIEVFSTSQSGNVAPLKSISGVNTRLSNPTAIAFDKKGTRMMMVADTDDIYEFPLSAHGDQAPSETISAPTVQDCAANQF